ncbi:hypothetical protein [Escherichia coli]|nr:hypothetical protein [Escherichia coli]
MFIKLAQSSLKAMF